MSMMPSHGNAGRMMAGNAQASFQGPTRENFAMGPYGKYGSMSGAYAPGMAGGQVMQSECAFPQPPPKRCYCAPAAFTSLDGRSHHRILDAYGSSRPCSCCQ